MGPLRVSNIAGGYQVRQFICIPWGSGGGVFPEEFSAASEVLGLGVWRVPGGLNWRWKTRGQTLVPSICCLP